MSLIFWILPLFAVFVSGEIISTEPSKLVLPILKKFEAAYGAYAITRDVAFLDITKSKFHKYNGKSCMTTISKCAGKKKSEERCVKQNLKKGAIAKMIREMNVTEIRNVNRQYREESYTEFGNVQQTEWELSNGKKTMTCKVEIKVHTYKDKYPDVSMMTLACDHCEFEE